MNEVLQTANLIIAGIAILVLGYFIRGLVDKRKANEEQVLIKTINAAMTRLQKIRKPDADEADAAAAAEAATVSQIKSIQTRAQTLL